MEQLDRVAQSSAASSEELAATSETLSAHAQKLQQVIGFFKLGDDVKGTEVKAATVVDRTSDTPKLESVPSDEEKDFESFAKAV